MDEGLPGKRDGSIARDGTPSDASADAPAFSSTVVPLVLDSWEFRDGVVKRGDAWRKYRDGLGAFQREDFATAEQLLAEAIEIEGTYDLAQAALGVVFMRTKDHRRCVEVSERCVRSIFEPKTLGACSFNLGKCFEHLGDDSRAFEAYRVSLEFRANATVERAIAVTGRRLKRPKAAQVRREQRESLVKSASEDFLVQRCTTKVSGDDRPGVLACGALTVWGVAGSFTDARATEVILTVSDPRIAHAKGSGYGVLLSKASEGWRERAKTDLLAPGEGGVDFEGYLSSKEGRDQVVVQVSDCWEGCCRGWVQAVRVERTGETMQFTAEKLLPVGLDRAEPSLPTKRALVTGVRTIDENGDGHAELLLRFEARLGKANPLVSYHRVRLEGDTAKLTGQLPPRAIFKRCSSQ